MAHDGGADPGTDGGAGGGQRFGRIERSAFSIGGSHVTNTVVEHGGTATDAPGAAELLAAVRALRAALVHLPRSADRTALDGELDEAAGELAETGAIAPGLPGRLRAALERWAPLVEPVNAATALGTLLATLAG
ncbi:hypothetical protein [Streptomyces subrutilus]|uniref:Uncharacterized protein n=1 Tax=Streptomyces subrutilus TaxID=36818 RepID=A0A5P2UL91_9ACTN|nr:hypothetical protein [Streptomyces subrutilus]QEU79179.1 hypothetical protein CP968_13425 [Streptomyces subrutilus]WSJ31633.1 hypothetical protein OG479_21400 [Streptomyces subrutilus]GGZ52478.1 hypothetical protein GCM10010371_09910 [Streptomyces subrutilus]